MDIRRIRWEQNMGNEVETGIAEWMLRFRKRGISFLSSITGEYSLDWGPLM